MPISDKELLMYQKATVYDLLTLTEAEPDKRYTVAELNKLFRDYIKSQEQK